LTVCAIQVGGRAPDCGGKRGRQAPLPIIGQRIGSIVQQISRRIGTVRGTAQPVIRVDRSIDRCTGEPGSRWFLTEAVAEGVVGLRAAELNRPRAHSARQGVGGAEKPGQAIVSKTSYTNEPVSINSERTLTPEQYRDFADVPPELENSPTSPMRKRDAPIIRIGIMVFCRDSHSKQNTLYVSCSYFVICISLCDACTGVHQFRCGCFLTVAIRKLLFSGTYSAAKPIGWREKVHWMFVLFIALYAALDQCELDSHDA
jgi:hypothetical protein